MSTSNGGPDWLLGEILGKSHEVSIDFVSFKQSFELLFPMVIEADVVYQPGAGGQGIVDPAVVVWVETLDQFLGTMLRQLKFEGELMVPQATVVSAQVADYGQVVQERTEVTFIHVIAMGDSVAIGAIAEFSIPHGELS